MSLQDRLHEILGFEDIEVVEAVAAPEEVVAEVVAEVVEPVDPPVPAIVHEAVVVDSEIAVSDATIAEHEQEITQVQSDMDALEDRIEDLEENIEGMESMFNGTTPWNPELAQKYFADARKIYQRSFKATPAGLDAVKGAECFAEHDTAEMELRAGLEELKKGAAAMAEGAKKFFAHLFQVVAAFFTGIFNKLTGIERKADLLVKRIQDTPDDKIKDTIHLGGWNSYLNVAMSNAIEYKSDAVNSAATALSTQSESALVAGLRQSCDIFAKGFKQTSTSSTDDTTTTKGRIHGIEFTIVEPKADADNKAAAIRKSKVSFKPVSEDNIKTSGEYKSGKSKSTLIDLAKKTKTEAAATRAAKLDSSSLNAARDKAIAAAKSEGGDESKGKVAAIKEGNKAILRVASSMIKYQTNLIAAEQAFIAAHV